MFEISQQPSEKDKNEKASIKINLNKCLNFNTNRSNEEFPPSTCVSKCKRNLNIIFFF